MSDQDLLDLLEILGDMTEAIATLGEQSSISVNAAAVQISTGLAQRKIVSFTQAITQRMAISSEQV